MRRESPFRATGEKSLRVTEIPADPKLLLSFKGSYGLRQQLGKTVKRKAVEIPKETQLRSPQPIEEALLLEVAALDNFRAPPTRDKTKQLVESIKLRRRQRHLEALSRFKEELDQYRQDLVGVYSGVESDALQVLNIKGTQVRQYLASQTSAYILTREIELLSQINTEVQGFKRASVEKLKQSREELQRIRSERAGAAESRCSDLAKQLAEIAFVLESQASELAVKQRAELQSFEGETFQIYWQKFEDLSKNQQVVGDQISKLASVVEQNWRNVKQEAQLKLFLEDLDSQQLRFPERRRRLYLQLSKLQEQNERRKEVLIDSTCRQGPDSLIKINVEKWSEQLKMIGDAFGRQLDRLVQELMNEAADNQKANQSRLESFRNRLAYIGKRSAKEQAELLNAQCQPLCHRNIEQAKQLLKRATDFVETGDTRENEALEALWQFLGNIATKNDDFAKKFGTQSQEHQVQKAKILDEDEQKVEALRKQLEELRLQLREAVHHIKLEELEGLCFAKIDELEAAYRYTHDRNKQIAAAHPAILQKFMEGYQAQVAQAFALYDQARRGELAERNRKEAEEAATKKAQQQEKLKAQEELRQVDESKKKGGKPAVKPRDPKKIQAELEQRKKAIMIQMGVKPIEQVRTSSGSVWLVYRSALEIAKSFFKTSQLGQIVRDYEGKPVVSQKFLIAERLAGVISEIRDRQLEGVSKRRSRILLQSKDADEGMVEESLQNLDGRLRKHYSMKGELEAGVFVGRSGEITGHKKEYQIHVRKIKERMDLQTQKFNYLLQKALKLMRDHVTLQKTAKDQLVQGKTLADFQGCQRRAHDAYKSFTSQLKQIGMDLNRLAGSQLEAVLKKNQEFLKKAKLIPDGGDFSTSQAEWYAQMMGEVDVQIGQQKLRRTEKAAEVKDHGQRRSKELLDQFEKEYSLQIQELSAKEGTGKKYGRPKRIAQQRLRLQMNKCQQAQLNIDRQIDRILQQFHQTRTFPNRPPLVSWRGQLVTLQSGIIRYARHLEALVPGYKARPLPRFTRLEGNPDALLTPEEDQQDRKRVIQQILELGPLGEQKEEKPFMRFLDDIEKVIGDEARAIYSGDKAKYLVDRLPDFLRIYIANMRHGAEDFRQSSIRSLRQSCGRFANSANQIGDAVLRSLEDFHFNSQQTSARKIIDGYGEIYRQHQQRREANIKNLRPNLINPKCQAELKELDGKERARQQELLRELKKMLQKFQDQHFRNGTQFLANLVNNSEMLMIFFDGILLPQDFIKVSGDQAQEKQHLDARKLLLAKQRGISIDPGSERNIRKKWEGLSWNLFNFGQKKYQPAKPVEEVKDPKDKKGAKKQSKQPKKEEVSTDSSKPIETFKTWRVKQVFQRREEAVRRFGDSYKASLEKVKGIITKSLQENQSFIAKWQAIAKDLYLSK